MLREQRKEQGNGSSVEYSLGNTLHGQFLMAVLAVPVVVDCHTQVSCDDLVCPHMAVPR